ncbi:MAG: hypothetical protein V3573_13290 [Desulfovibrionaceae bacterium]
MANSDYSQLMQALGGSARLEPGTGMPRAGSLNREQAKEVAFQTQMQMAMRLFSGNESEVRSPSPQLGGTLMNDALLFDALSSISQIMHGDNGLVRAPANVVRGSVPQRQENAIVAGALSAQFESGEKGVEAIGYDRVGGTSYGKFQIASRTGTMDRFLKFLDSAAPEWSERLRASGPANTGSRRGSMPREWAKIASEAPERFERLQREFIREDHYRPAREKILARTGIDVDQLPLAAREVLWSTAVQHGASGAAGIFKDAIAASGQVDSKPDFVRKLIGEVYDSRKEQFGSSSRRVRNSVRSRMDQEKELALAMLSGGGVSRLV